MIENSNRVQELIDYAVMYALQKRHEYLVPEHLLKALVDCSKEFAVLMEAYGVDELELSRYHIMDALRDLDTVPGEEEYEIEPSVQMQMLIGTAAFMAESAGKKEVDLQHILHAMLQLDESTASYLLLTQFTDDEARLLRDIVDACEGREVSLPISVPDAYVPVASSSVWDEEEKEEEKAENERWRKMVTCVNDTLKDHNPLIGRDVELERTIQVLCRCDKNNPLHIGEPGVGKTALVYGLAQRIEEGRVPERLKGAKIYQLDMASLVAGTMYRGEFEERIKTIMAGVGKEENSIVYIDEIHTLVGTGTIGESALDGSNILKPYLESGRIRFIGATTYKEYNRYFQKSQGMTRRFQTIDIMEPTEDEAVLILEGLKERYEAFHHIKYEEGVMAHAVKMSKKYMADRFLPDKAIDLIDEAGAYRELHPVTRNYKGEPQVLKKQTVGVDVINDTIMRVCKLTEQTMETTENGTEKLETLKERMLSKIYGQDEAVNNVTEAVMMGKAGLLDDDKPLAAMLFVGPTGVGKTEVCRVLADELGVPLVRFDMSEYAEKHTVAKLIGSPAGYVGYEDGGLLTDAIRKTPNCVLLLDEIEKAHGDIYNILLQVMDYARLTDNKGQKADFRHVILIMTSNAGAQYASQASVGFASKVTAGDAMLQAVKKTFKPEFIGRLTSTVVFHDMDREMARRILKKKLTLLEQRLMQRKVTMNVSEEAMALLLEKGFTKRNGARELDRTINTLLTPLFTREILFGNLKNGGEAKVTVKDSAVYLVIDD